MTVQGHCGMTGSCEKRDRHEEICQSRFFGAGSAGAFTG